MLRTAIKTGSHFPLGHQWQTSGLYVVLRTLEEDSAVWAEMGGKEDSIGCLIPEVLAKGRAEVITLF